MARHDSLAIMCKSNFIRVSYEVYSEMAFNTSLGVEEQDLIFVRNRRYVVIDVQVVGEINIAEVYLQKFTK